MGGANDIDRRQLPKDAVQPCHVIEAVQDDQKGTHVAQLRSHQSQPVRQSAHGSYRVTLGALKVEGGCTGTVQPDQRQQREVHGAVQVLNDRRR